MNCQARNCNIESNVMYSTYYKRGAATFEVVAAFSLNLLEYVCHVSSSTAEQRGEQATPRPGRTPPQRRSSLSGMLHTRSFYGRP